MYFKRKRLGLIHQFRFNFHCWRLNNSEAEKKQKTLLDPFSYWPGDSQTNIRILQKPSTPCEIFACSSEHNRQMIAEVL